MEKIAFIIDGGYFVKKYKQLKKEFPVASDVETYILNILNFLKKENNFIEIYRIFYYDCPPLHNLSGVLRKPGAMEENDFTKMCENLKESIK